MLTPKQVHEQFGLSRDDLRRLERDGLISPQRTRGGHRRYDPREIERFARKNGHGPTREIFMEYGVSGLREWGGHIWEERLKELRGTAGRILLREMRLNDPVIAAVFTAIERFILEVEWRVMPASESPQDREAAQFLESCLHDMSFTWNNTIQFILQMLEQGFSLLEIVYKRRLEDDSKFPDGRVGWKKWAPRPAETIEQWVFDDAGGIKAAIQRVPDSGEMRTIPIEKSLLFRTTVAPANSPEGVPIHRSMYIPYWYSQNIQEIEGIGVERDLAGIPVIYLGNDCTLKGANSDFELARELVVNLRNDEQVGVVIPKPKLGTAGEGEGMLLELLSTGGRRQHNTSEIIERYDKRKALAVLAQFIMLGIERTGSYALGQLQSDLFGLALQGFVNDIADVINTFAVPRLFKYNSFPEISDLPRVKPSIIGFPDLKDMAEFVNSLVGSKVLTPDQELERHLRHIARLPQPSMMETKPSQARTSVGDTSMELRRTILALRAAQDIGAVKPETIPEAIKPVLDRFLASIGAEGK